MSRARKTKKSTLSEPIDLPIESRRAEAQVIAELAALTPCNRLDAHAPEALIDLITAAIASGETPTPASFLDGAMRTLADDLMALYSAVTDDGGNCCNYKLDLDKLPIMIWRLSHRASSAVEIATRMREAEGIRAGVAAETKADVKEAAE